MRRTGNLVTIPILNDLIFTLLFNSTSAQRIGLPTKYLYMLMSAAKTRAFVTTSSREEKEFILSHYGFQFFYVVMPKDMNKIGDFREQLEEHSKGKKIQNLVYMHSDEQLSYYMKLYAKSIHHPTYFMNYEIMRAGYHIQNWGRHNVNREQMEVRELIESENILTRTILSSIIMEEFFQGTNGLTTVHVHILLFLYIKRHSYTPKEAMYDFFKGFGRYGHKNYLRNATRELINESMVQKNPEDNAYSITSLGIKKVAEFRDSVLSYNFMY